MKEPSSIQALIDILNELGIPAGPLAEGAPARFPFALHVPTGESIVLDLPEPACLRYFDETDVGFAIVDKAGYTASRWGAANHAPEFDALACLLDGPLAGLFLDAMHLGQSNRLHNKWRYFAVRVGTGDAVTVHILIATAGEEAAATKRADLNSRHVDALKRIGKALTMNQTLQPLAVNAVHTISAALELAAVLLWVRTSDEAPLNLMASVGTNRTGTTILGELHLDDGITCVAELAAAQGEALLLKKISESPMTTDLEAKFCYLHPGSLFAIPLMIGPRLIGVLELISRQGDVDFLESEDLLITIAEHLALAINSAMMFESVERLASSDALTGVANHRMMQEFLARRVVECERNNTQMGVVMLDVDHFRSFNEEEGHDAGDEVLKLVAEVLTSSIRGYDLAARYGGEEFTLIMPSIGPDMTMHIAERVRQRIESLVYFTKGGQPRHITASLGCAIYPDTATEPAALLKAADSALFAAKRGGRNRTIMYSHDTDSDERSRIVSTETVLPWVRDEHRKTATKLLERSSDTIHHLAGQLQLTENQVQILRAAIMIAPTYLAAVAANDDAYLAEIRATSDLRAVAPCLTTLGERYDIHGNLLPILGRSLAALLAHFGAMEGGLTSDSGKYDPEIAALVAGFDQAA